MSNYLEYTDRGRILSYYKEACMIKQGIMPWPRMAIVYPVYGCNRNCTGCMYGDYNKIEAIVLIRVDILAERLEDCTFQEK
jgi:hypothetical protein